MLLHSVGEERRGARARSGARRASSREVRNKSGTNRREAAIVPPASGTPCRRAKFARFAAQPGHKRWNFLGSSVVVVPSSDKIRQKIIGHSCRDGSRLAQRFRGHDRGNLAFSVLHQPASQHRATIFLDPLVYQGGDFLSQIRSMAKPGQFVALQTISRCGQQEFPRRGNSAAGHRASLGMDNRYARNVSIVTQRYS